MICRKCGEQNTESSKNCKNCGYLLNEEEKYQDREKNIDNENKNINVKKIKNEDDYIFDRKKYKSKSKTKSFLIKLVLILILLIVLIFSFYVIKIADSNNKKILSQKEEEIEKEKELEELKLLEDYKNQFNSLLSLFENQKDLIELNLNSMRKLKLNKYGKNLKFGDNFNGFINKVFDNSSVNELVEESASIEVLIKELENPPDNYKEKYEKMLELQTIENQIKDEFYPEINKKSKENVEMLFEKYKMILYSLKEG